MLHLYILHIKYPGLLQPGHTTTGGLQKKIIKENKMFISAYWIKGDGYNIWS